MKYVQRIQGIARSNLAQGDACFGTRLLSCHTGPRHALMLTAGKRAGAQSLQSRYSGFAVVFLQRQHVCDIAFSIPGYSFAHVLH
jgi:hypothetical protein